MKNRYKLSALIIMIFGLLILNISMDTHAEETVIEINENTFPDPVFRDYVSSKINTNGGNELSVDEIDATTTINVSEMNISDLSGIEYFTSLKELYCEGNPIEELIVSGIETLETLNCRKCKIERLDISGCSSLVWISFDYNPLVDLNMSDCIYIEELRWTNLQNGSRAPDLSWMEDSQVNKYFDIDYRFDTLKSVNVSGCSSLKTIRVMTGLQEFSFDGCSNLESIDLIIENEDGGCLDFSGHEKLKSVSLGGNIKSVDFSDCINLYLLILGHGNPSASYLENKLYSPYSGPAIYGYKSGMIESVNLSGCVALDCFICTGNKLTELNLLDCVALRTLLIAANQLNSIDVSGCSELLALDCSYNNLTEIKVSDCTKLETLYCYGNQVNLIEGSSSIVTLLCGGNMLEELDVSGYTALRTLDCSSNQIKTITLNTYLNDLNCSSNQIERLDLSSYGYLYSANCSNNKLELLIVGNALNKLFCYGNTDISIDMCKSIKLIAVSSASFTAVMIDNNTYCYQYANNDKSVLMQVDPGAYFLTEPCVDHEWNDGVIIEESTCTQNGMKKYTCKKCKETKTEEIDLANHSIVIDKAIQPTYTLSGLTEGSHCSVCGKVIKKQEIIPKLVRNGWLKESGKWYYYMNGTKVTGWKSSGGKWYFFDNTGAMIIGWKSISGTWYYFETSGAMATGWKAIGGKWYFFKKSGAMATNEWCGGYWLNANGTWTYKKVASWKRDSVGWWYGCSGWYAKNQWQKIDDKWYYFDSRGYIVTGTRKIGNKTYTFNSSGVCLNP
ncbi:MAG: hypothetical protein J6O53_03155 [Eubacterium sp.]|nr:hypothetical protein [Eubacterium sp.]